MRHIWLVLALLLPPCVAQLEGNAMLPTSRNRTYGAGSQVSSADLNDFQDQIIALKSDLTAVRTKYIVPASGQVTSPAADFQFSPTSGHWTPLTTAQTLILPLPDDATHVGATILTLAAYITTDVASGSRNFFLYHRDYDGANDTQVETVASSATSSSVVLTLSSSLPYVIPDQKTHVLLVTLRPGDTLHSIGVTYQP